VPARQLPRFTPAAEQSCRPASQAHRHTQAAPAGYRGVLSTNSTNSSKQSKVGRRIALSGWGQQHLGRVTGMCGCLTPVVLGKDSGAKPLQLEVRSFSMACYGCSTVCTIRVGCRQNGLHTVATSAQHTLRYMQCSAHNAERVVTDGVTSLGAAASHTVATSATDSLQCMHRSAHDG
jgi:hypothetical protein